MANNIFADKWRVHCHIQHFVPRWNLSKQVPILGSCHSLTDFIWQQLHWNDKAPWQVLRDKSGHLLCHTLEPHHILQDSYLSRLKIWHTLSRTTTGWSLECCWPEWCPRVFWSGDLHSLYASEKWLRVDISEAGPLPQATIRSTGESSCVEWNLVWPMVEQRKCAIVGSKDLLLPAVHVQCYKPRNLIFELAVVLLQHRAREPDVAGHGESKQLKLLLFLNASCQDIQNFDQALLTTQIFLQEFSLAIIDLWRCP